VRSDLELDILAYLSENPKSKTRDILSFLKLLWFVRYGREAYLRITMYRALHRLLRHRLLEKDGFGRYSITENGERQLAHGLLVLELQNTIRSKLRPYSILKKQKGG